MFISARRSIFYGRAYAEANPFHHRRRDKLEELATAHHAAAQLCALRGHRYVVVDTRDGSGLLPDRLRKSATGQFEAYAAAAGAFRLGAKDDI